MRVSVIGAGYVGLVTGACLAEHGHQVWCVDADPIKVAAVDAGRAHFFEPGLDELLARHAGRSLWATTELARAVEQTDISIIAVGTPFSSGRADLSQVDAAATAIGKALATKSYHVVVVKSTVIPGTTEEIVGAAVARSSGQRAGIGFGLAMNPEFLREGEAVQDFLHPDRIVIGGIDARSIEAVAGLYAGFAGVNIMRTNLRTAEMIKYANNALLATLISFSNEIGNLCAAHDELDVADVLHGVHLDKRITPMIDGRRVVPGLVSYLAAGCGFGGSCLPKDVKALAVHGQDLGMPMRLLNAVIDVNRDQPMQILSALEQHFGALTGVRVAVLGAAFKAGTDDIRESAAVPLIHGLLDRSARVSIFDPIAAAKLEALFGDRLVVCDGLQQCVTDSDAVVIVTAWDAFKTLPALLQSIAVPPMVVDGRRMLDKQSVATYAGIGLARPRRSEIPTAAAAS
jgi:UDPglucose 6-dehydrogenase